METSGKWAWAALAVAAGVLVAVVRVNGETRPVAQRQTVAFRTHLSTDKAVYHPGERVWIRGVLLRATDQVPAAEGSAQAPTLEVRSPRGEVVFSGAASLEKAVAAIQWAIPPELAGGRYTALLRYRGDEQPPAERSFEVRAYRPRRLKTQIEFARDGYGPGDRVQASLEVVRAEGDVPAGAKVRVEARVDGVQVHVAEGVVDATGRLRTDFALPAQIARGEGTLSFAISDGGVEESAGKTIPIALMDLDVGIFPEGGALVAGLATRVYLEARTPEGLPADVEGEVRDKAGEVVARFSAQHDGRARLELLPLAGERYAALLTRPSGIARSFNLGPISEDGATVRASGDALLPTGPAVFQVQSTRDETLTLTLSKGGQRVGSAEWRHLPGSTRSVTVKLPQGVHGVLAATVWDHTGLPLAERLVFRKPSKSLSVEVKPLRSRYAPGEEVVLEVTTRDERGRPVPAVVGLTVTDDAALELVDRRDQAPRLPQMALLEPEVAELKDAHVYLDPKRPEAAVALDLLLGTQGWRRFALADTDRFEQEHGDAARRVLARYVPPPVWATGDGWGFGMGGGGVGGAAELRAAAVPKGVALAAVAPDRPPLPPAPAPMAAVEIAERDENAEVPAELEATPDVDLHADGDELKNLPATKVQARRVAAQGIAMDFEEAQIAGPRWVRVFAHKSAPPKGERNDLTETIYWNAGIATDKASGKATVRFSLSHALTGFRAQADAFSKQGALGAGSALLESVKPLSISAKWPLFVTEGDEISLPVIAENATDKEISAEVKLSVEGQDAITAVSMVLRANTSGRRIVSLDTTGRSGDLRLHLDASAGIHHDGAVHTLKVRPRGFPVEQGFSGMLRPGGTAAGEIAIAEGVSKDSAHADVVVYPTPLANLSGALERLIAEPYGCFEQTSSTTYPLIMAQQYFLSHTGVEPALIKRSSELLDKGYDRLRSFECKQKGYEWFAEDPGHEALTAFGLMEFSDLEKVRPVDAEMLARTRAWLLSRRDGKGGFLRERRALHTWLEDREVSDAYILWTLLESGATGLGAEIESVRKAAVSTNNAYVLALGANCLWLAGDKDAARVLMKRLASNIGTDKLVAGGTQSVVGSEGESLLLETSALAVLAWLRDDSFSDAVENVISGLASACEGGRFGTTQSTVLVLRAIVQYDKQRAAPKAPGAVELWVDGQKLAEQAFGTDPHSKGAHGPIAFPDFGAQLSPGTHRVELKMREGSAMPFSVTARYHAKVPPSQQKAPVQIETTLTRTEAVEGEPLELKVSVANTRNAAVPSPTVIAALPGGLDLRTERLDELVKRGDIAAWELRDSEVVLYFRSLGASQRVDLVLPATAAVPGAYTAPASRAYLYYADDLKHWVPGTQIRISAKG